MIKNCNEFKHVKTCKSAYFGGLGCKHKIKPSVIALILVFVLSIGTVASAMTKDEEAEVIEVIEIDAEDIGIEAIETEVEEDEDVDIETESEILDDETVREEEIIEDTEQEVEEDDEVVTESPAPPEGMAEGYIAGTYFEPNCFDCELHEYCYKCEECTFEEEESYDEDRGIYVLDKWCTVCGHGTSEVISNEEFELLGVETDVEF